MQNAALWQSVLGEIELSVSHATFTTWFKNTELIDQSESGITISVPNIFAKKQFEVKFNDQVRGVLSKNGINPKQITYTINTTGKHTRPNRETTNAAIPSTDIDGLLSVNNKSKIGQTSVGNLNPRYTFDNFIVGSSNDLAYATGQAVAANPGVKYNPLYIYGGVGLGKTHLVQAIGNEIIKKDPRVRVLYISSETFVSEFLDYIRFKKKGFSEKYRNVDVLIVDDMQFIAGKEKTQE
jgi:chromosomal replication initiator protein